MAEKYWKYHATRQKGRKPSKNQMDFETLVPNIKDGKLFLLKENDDGTTEIVEFIGGPPGSFEVHPRAHQVDSIADHLPTEHKNKIVASNPETGAIEFIDKSSCDRHYMHTQSNPLSNWSIAHNLGKFPSVTVVDSAGTQVLCEILHNDLNSTTIKFSEPFSGFAYLN